MIDLRLTRVHICCAGSASLCTLGLRPHPASNQYPTLPALLRKTGDTMPVDSAVARCADRWTNHVEPSIVRVRLRPPDSTSDHVDELDSHTHVRRREEQPFDEIRVSRSVLTILSHEPLMKDSHFVVIASAAVVCDNKAHCVSSTFAGNILKKVLKSFCYNLISPEIEIRLVVHITERISCRTLTYARNDLRRAL